MSVTITLEDIQAYTEVDYIINHMNSKYREKVPEKMLNFFSKYKDPNYTVNINPYIPLQKQGLKRYTLEIIALLHLKYWCENEERKKELYNIMLQNQEKLDNRIRQQYDLDNIFESEDSGETEEKEDFSRPRVIQKYNQYTEQNSDIKDYTDLQESVDENQNDTLISKENKNIFQKIKEKLFSIFHKKP